MTTPERPASITSPDTPAPSLTFQASLSGQQLLGILLLPIAIWILWRLWIIAALLLLAQLIAVGLNPAVSRLEARGFSRSTGTLSLYSGILLGLVGLAYLVARILAVQFGSFMIALPDLLMQWQQALERLFPAANLSAVPDQIASLSLAVAGLASLALQGVLAFLLVVLISFYLLLDGPRLWAGALRLVPDARRQMAEALGLEIARRLRGYLRGVGTSGVIVGVLTAAGLAILGVPYWLLFGVLAGLLEAIPMLGPILASIGPITLALAHSPGRALLVAALFVVVQQLEDKLLVPRIQSHATGLHPLIVILAVLVLGSLFGFLGVLLAVPLAAVVQALVVCGVNCFYHPEGAEAWLAARRRQTSATNEGSEQVFTAVEIEVREG